MEIELKYQVPAPRRNAVRTFVAGRGSATRRRIHLQAAYFDTPDRLLARSGMALRLRREGRDWVQTLKGQVGDGLGRDEHNLPLAASDPAVKALLADPHRHAGVPVGERLLALLATEAPDALQCIYRTDIWRLTRPLRGRHGQVELAFDEGWLVAGDRRQPVCELEIELVAGHPQAVIDVARRWALRLDLWLDSRSKAERGDMLSRGAEVVPPVKAVDVTLARGMSAREGLQRVLGACRKQVIVNASQVADDRSDPEHVHQLRVGLRRLRTAFQLFADDAEAAALAAPMVEPAAELFRRLGVARDAAVMEGDVAAALRAALAEFGASGELPTPAAATEADSPSAAVRDRASQGLLLDLIAAGFDAAPEPATGRVGRRSGAGPAAPAPCSTAVAGRARGLRRLLATRLDRWHRAVLRDAAAFESLDVVSRHRLRKRIKRLRYAAEFASGLFDPARVRATLKPLRQVQDRLGLLNDIALGLHAFEPLKAQDPRAWFALGWLAARRDALMSGAVPDLQALANANRFWKKKS